MVYAVVSKYPVVTPVDRQSGGAADHTSNHTHSRNSSRLSGSDYYHCIRFVDNVPCRLFPFAVYGLELADHPVQYPPCYRLVLAPLLESVIRVGYPHMVRGDGVRTGMGACPRRLGAYLLCPRFRGNIAQTSPSDGIWATVLVKKDVDFNKKSFLFAYLEKKQYLCSEME